MSASRRGLHHTRGDDPNARERHGRSAYRTLHVVSTERAPGEVVFREDLFGGRVGRSVLPARVVRSGSMAKLEYDVQRTDKYQRTLAYAYLPDGTFLNAAIVKQGYGHAYVQYPFKYLDQFRVFADDRAKQHRQRLVHIDAIRLRAPGAARHLDARRVHHRILHAQTGEIPMDPEPIPARFVAAAHRRVGAKSKPFRGRRDFLDHAIPGVRA
jgi:Staphylococcal nuclease homologue